MLLSSFLEGKIWDFLGNIRILWSNSLTDCIRLFQANALWFFCSCIHLKPSFYRQDLVDSLSLIQHVYFPCIKKLPMDTLAEDYLSNLSFCEKFAILLHSSNCSDTTSFLQLVWLFHFFLWQIVSSTPIEWSPWHE